MDARMASGSWDLGEFREASARAVELLARYVDDSQAGRGPAVRRAPFPELVERLDLRRLVREGGLDLDGFADFLERYLEYTVRLHHPAELAHQVASPDVPAAMADLVHGVTNNPMALYEMGPAAAAIEVVVLEWMLETVGFDPAVGGGVLTHGGSLANLTALLAARAAAVPDAWEDGAPGDLAILAPPSAHFSVARSAAITGLGERAIVPLEVDGLERIVPAAIPDAVERARTAGRRPIALVAAACATATGLHDDLRPIAEACRAHGLWFHVDAAHGGSGLLSPAHRHLLDGIELADSLIWDAHKMLRTSGLCAAVLVRRAEHLDGAFHQKASYLFYGDGHDGVDLMMRAVECTKAELGLKLFLELAWRGPAALGEYVAGRYDLTRRLHGIISARPGFECPYVPESNILCFRYGSDGAEQIAIRERLLAIGDFHLSSTEIAGQRYLRLTVMAPSTDEATIERLLDRIEQAAGEPPR
jgi:L-2,4-diaminobutyrate decarboxylase